MKPEFTPSPMMTSLSTMPPDPFPAGFKRRIRELEEENAALRKRVADLEAGNK